MSAARNNGEDEGAASAGGAPGELPTWGEGLAYPDWLEAAMPSFHSAFNLLNRYVSVPALKAGLGRYMSNPFSGYLMILRTRGRRSGEMRDAPVGYAIVGDAVCCIGGFGRRTNWYQNLLADPHVEVILPGRSFSGLAEEVTLLDERLEVLPPLLRSMGPLVETFGLGNPRRDTPEELVRKCEGMPLVRVRPTGIAAGPDDPGGRFWVVPIVASAALAVWWLRGWRGAKK
jgi:deazaflavin-dependent oxidoreductase (nitroreductase family)